MTPLAPTCIAEEQKTVAEDDFHLPQMSHPLHNLRISFYAKRPITNQSSSEQERRPTNLHRCILGCKLPGEMRTSQFYFPLSLLYYNLFNWIIMASVRDYLYMSHLNTIGSYLFILSFLVDKIRCRHFTCQYAVAGCGTKTIRFIWKCYMIFYFPVSIFQRWIRLFAEQLPSDVCAHSKSHQIGMNIRPNSYSSLLLYSQRIWWQRNMQRIQSIEPRTNRICIIINSPWRAPCDRSEIKLDSRSHRYSRINIRFSPFSDMGLCCRHIVFVCIGTVPCRIVHKRRM